MFLQSRTYLASAASLEDQNFLSENRLAARPAIIPAAGESVDYEHKEASDRILCLDGDWKFAYCQEDCIDSFFAADHDDSTWDIIPVPSMWQYLGYCGAKYPQLDYPFPLDPPYIDIPNPVGYYRKGFAVPTTMPTDRVILHFGGVDSCCFVYLNGEYIGYSQGSRIPAEFDVTDVIRPSGNMLAVKVFTYCDGSYLENQDMLLASGIFRSVYLTFHRKAMIWDYDVYTDCRGIDFAVDVDVMVPGDYTVKVEVDGQALVLPAEGRTAKRIDIANPRLWTAETPERYRVDITLYDGEEILERIHKYVGLREVRIEGMRLLVNGKPITVKGVNRHEHECHVGRAITAEFTRMELTLIKESNFNAIRCSHYINNPFFYDMATELGLYVMDEADMETHGCEASGDQGLLSKTPSWLPAYLDRVERMVACDHNESCIIIWSIGNECGRGENLLACANYLRSISHPLPIHSAQGQGGTDFTTTGYMPQSVLDSLEAEEGLPVMITEFAHAMGNSPGGLYDYWEKIYRSRRIVGGYVWEFKSHGMYTTDADGHAWYRYGGDFPDDPNHWSNFSIDGYLTSDGTPKPSFHELRQALTPAWLEMADGQISVRNTLDFRSLDYLEARWTLSEDGAVIANGRMDMPAVAPRSAEVLPFVVPSVEKKPGALYTLEFYLYDGEREVASRQLILPNEQPKEKYVPAGACCWEEQEDALRIWGDGFCYAFRNGLLASAIRDNRVVMETPVEFCVTRAATDNDGIVGVFPRTMGEWENWSGSFLHTMKFRCRSLSVTEEEGWTVLRAMGKVNPVGRYAGYEVELCWKVDAAGIILCSMHVEPYGKLPSRLPRFGMVFTLAGDMRNVSWLGRGPEENYPDEKMGQAIGRYSMDVGKTYFRYDVPQECGSHEDVSYVSVAGKSGSMGAAACGPMAFTAHDFALDTLKKARHCHELVPDGKVHLYLDYKMRGLGSNSCGPHPEEAYEFRPHTFSFGFVLVPGAKDGDLLPLARMDFGVENKALSGTYVPDDRKIREMLDCSEE